MGRCHLHSKKVGVCFDNQRQLHMPTSYSGTSTLLTNSVVFKLLGRVWAALSACRGGRRQQHNPRIILLWPRGQGGAFSLINLTSCQGVGGLESLWRVFCSLEIIQNAITIHFCVVITKPEIRLNHVYKLQEVLQVPRPWPEVRLVKAPPQSTLSCARELCCWLPPVPQGPRALMLGCWETPVWVPLD